MTQQPQIFKNTYSISKTRTLIDVNHDKINFRTAFHIRSLNQKPFLAVIVDQNTLDKSDNIQFKQSQSNGIMSGEIVSDKNTQQQYYIMIKSDTPSIVEVELQTIHLPDYIDPPQPETESKEQSFSSLEQSYTTYIFAIIGILLLGYVFMNLGKSEGGKGGSGTSKKGGTGGGGRSLLNKLKNLPIE